MTIAQSETAQELIQEMDLNKSQYPKTVDDAANEISGLLLDPDTTNYSMIYSFEDYDAMLFYALDLVSQEELKTRFNVEVDDFITPDEDKRCLIKFETAKNLGHKVRIVIVDTSELCVVATNQKRNDPITLYLVREHN